MFLILYPCYIAILLQIIKKILRMFIDNKSYIDRRKNIVVMLERSIQY